MKKLSLFLLVVLFCIGSLRAQTREGSVNSRSFYQEQAGQLSPRGAEGLSDPLMMWSKLIIDRKKLHEGGSDGNNKRQREDGESAGQGGNPGSVQQRGTISSARDPGNQAGSLEATKEDSSDNVNEEINTAKNYLVTSREELARINSSLVNPALCQQELGGLQEIMKKRHDDFLFQEAFSNEHAQLQAQDNADFFSAKLQDIQRSIETDHEVWLSREEQETRARVEVFRDSLKQVVPLLQNIQAAYKQLSDAYAEKANHGTDGIEERNILSLFESDEITADDQRVIIGQYGVVTLLELSAAQNLLERRPQIYKDGMNLVRIAVMKNCGIDAVKRFDETFHVSSIYSDPLTVGRVKEFIELEHAQAQTTNPSAPKSYFFSSIDSLGKLGRLSETEQAKLIRSNGHQLHFNPFSGEEPSLEHVTDDEETAWEGAIAVGESLKEEDFFKGARTLQQRDILNRFNKKFLGDKKDLLTIKACNDFIKEEREKSQEWKNKLYYRCFSSSHEMNQELWSWFSAIISGERAQQPFTDVSRPVRSLVISVISAYAMNAINDVTRPYRKPTKDDGIQSARAKEAVLAEDSNRNLYKNFSEIQSELEAKKENDIQAVQLQGTLHAPSGRLSIAMALTPTRAAQAAKEKIKAKYQDDIKAMANKRKIVVVERLQKYIDPVVDARIKASAKKIIDGINSAADENQVQENIDRAFQFLVEHSSQLVAEEREHLELIHQSLDLLSGKDFSQNLLCSSAEVETMQRLFEETKASFLLQQARFHENVPDMDQLQQIAAKNAALFFDKAAVFQRKLDGGDRTLLKVGDEDKVVRIRTQLDPLKQLHTIAQKAGDAYDQLSKIYSLRIARPSEAREGEIAPLNLTDQLLELKKLEAEEGHKVVVSHNGQLDLIEPHLVDDLSHPALKQNGISLVKLALFDAFGKEGVKEFNNSFQFKIAGKKSLSLKELQNFLASKFSDRSPDYFLSLGHSTKDILATDVSENVKVIRSNGRTFVYNPFSPKDVSQEYLLSDRATAQEGVASICASLAELDFFKKATKLNQYDVLKNFCQRFQGDNAKPLTVGAFKDFVQEEENKSKTWGHYLYYGFYDPYTLSQEWAGFMGFVTGARFQHPFKDWNVPEKFALTWVIDVLGEYTGQYREYRDGGIYHKLVETALNDMRPSSARSASIPNFEERLQEAQKKKEAQQSNANLYQYVVASQEYDRSVQKILVAQKSWLTELLEKRSATLASGDSKKATFTQMLGEINTSGEQLQKCSATLAAPDPNGADFFQMLRDVNKVAKQLEERVSEGMDLLTQDSDAATADAMLQLRGVQQALAELAHTDLSGNILFSKKDLEAPQQILTEQLANLGLEQIRSHQSPLEIEKLHASVAKNADFFFKKADDMMRKINGAWDEIRRENETRPGDVSGKTTAEEDELSDNEGSRYDEENLQASALMRTREVHRDKSEFISIFAELEKEFKTAAQAYDQLANAASLKMIAARKEAPQERESFISQLKNLTPEQGLQKIVLDNNSHLVMDGNVSNAPSEQDRLFSAAALPLLKSEIADTFGEEALRRFESQIKVKMIASHPLTVGDVQQLIESERTQHNNLSDFYLSAGHSLEQVLHASSSEDGRLLRSHGSQFRYNPFAEAQQKKSYITGDEKTAQKGVNAALKALREMDFFKKLTRLNQEYVATHFEERFKTPKRTWVQFLQSFIFEKQKQKPEALTVGAFKSFVQSEIQASEEWKNTYQFLNNPLYASTAWNVVAGAGVIARIDPRIINCTPIDIAVHYGGHRYLLHTITALTVFPHALHAVPSILISYGINRVAESWLHLRQRPVPSPIQP